MRKSRQDAEVLAKQTKADRSEMIGSLLSEVDKVVNTDEVDGFYPRMESNPSLTWASFSGPILPKAFTIRLFSKV